MTTEQFHLPDVGEGLTEAEIVTWHVTVGDTVAHNQVLVEIETAKSLVELPSPFEGTVTALLVGEGQTVQVGAPIVAIRTAASTPADTTNASTPNAVEHEPAAEPAVAPAPSILVGYGAMEDRPVRRRRRRTTITRPIGDGAAAVRSNVAQDGSSSGKGPLAKPPVRKLAKDLGLDLMAVTPSGPDRTITRNDVVRHAKQFAGSNHSPAPSIAPAAPTAVCERGEARIPIKGVRKATAASMSASAFTAPHVTEFLTVDVTRSVKLVDKLKADPRFHGSRVTTLLLVARALLTAAREYPDINTSWDDTTDEIVLYPEINLGIAAATPRGLMVPNVKNAGSLSLPALAAALTELIRTAREGRSTPADLSRGTITITNIGVFGVDTGTPILNPGEAAILCFGAVRRTPWEHRGKIALRRTTQLALSFDHRLVDGELGSKVLARVGEILENPGWELLVS